MKNHSLKSLAESKADGIQKATYFKVRPDVVEFEAGFNLREEGPELEAHIERLYLAMKSGAYIPPIDVSVVGARIVARDGHCRTRAARRLLAEGVEYLLEARQLRGNDADAVFHMLGSDQGKHFTPLEQGRGFLRLINMGHAVAEIAARTGLHRSTIENGLALAEAPAAVQQMVAAGKVASHTALKTVRKVGAEKAAETLAKGVQEAEKAGKTKATGKHLNAPKERGQTLPPKADEPQQWDAARYARGRKLALDGKALAVGVDGSTLAGYCDVAQQALAFVRGVSERSTLVTYQSRDMVQLIEAAYDITDPEETAK